MVRVAADPADVQPATDPRLKFSDRLDQGVQAAFNRRQVVLYGHHMPSLRECGGRSHAPESVARHSRAWEGGRREYDSNRCVAGPPYPALPELRCESSRYGGPRNSLRAPRIRQPDESQLGRAGGLARTPDVSNDPGLGGHLQ
ncbi:hypothetical protein GCM10010341_01030 [Streptomyces noursei]|nr:hypothetical protein GCM10010341_01030 [Streptomyces noursei]